MASVRQQPEPLVVAVAEQTVVVTCREEAVAVGPSVGEALQEPCEPVVVVVAGHLGPTFAVVVGQVEHLEQNVVAVVQMVLGRTVVAVEEPRLERIFAVVAVVGQIVVVGELHQVQIFVVAVGEVVAGQIVAAVVVVVALLFVVAVVVALLFAVAVAVAVEVGMEAGQTVVVSGVGQVVLVGEEVAVAD